MKKNYLIPIFIILILLIIYISYKNINLNSSITLNSNVEKSIINNNTNDNSNSTNNDSENDIQIKENTVSKTETQEYTNNTKTDTKYNDEKIISYFENLDEELTNYNNEDKTLGQKIKSKFINCIDFLFYNKEINGITFKELTNQTKLKILEITISIDSKMDSKFPDYKDDISNTYQNIKSKIIEKYLDVTTNICTEDKDLCNVAKENFQSLKENFSITWDSIKQLVGSGTSKIKDWYEIWKYN